MLKSAECKYSVEILHVKSLSHLVKDDVLFYSSSYNDVMWEWVCDVVERGMVGVYSELH